MLDRVTNRNEFIFALSLFSGGILVVVVVVLHEVQQDTDDGQHHHHLQQMDHECARRNGISGGARDRQFKTMCIEHCTILFCIGFVVVVISCASAYA